MRNFWLMAKHEYRKMVGKRSFLLGTLSIPLIMIVAMGLSIYISIRGEDRRPVGYVDQVGILATAVYPPKSVNSNMPTFRAFADEAAAQQALAAGEIQAYYVLPPDYLQTRALRLFYWEDSPQSSVRRGFADFIRANLAATEPEAKQKLLLGGHTTIMRSADNKREMDSSNPVNFILPFLVAFLFVMVVMGSAGYLLQVVTDEKENRTMEVMITSMTPLQLIGGKALGLMAVSLTQLLVWLVIGIIAVLIGAQSVPWLANISIPWSLLIVVAAFFLPSYALVAGLMTAVGGAVTELQQGQQIAGILNLLFIVPFFFLVFFFERPNSPLVLALTLFPTTSFFSMVMRWSTNIVPLWQVILSWLILTATAVFSVIASARIFRAGMLRYGQGLKLRGVLAAMRNP